MGNGKRFSLHLFQIFLVLSFELVFSIPMGDKNLDYVYDIDDTEVVEIPSNALDTPADDHKDIIDLSSYGPSIYGIPDTEITAALVGNYSAEESMVNPEELGTYLEGDILVPANRTLTRNGVISESSRWPKGVVPFEIRGAFTASDRNVIERAFSEYHTRTCIRFVPRTSESDYISIVSGNSGCWSSVGRIGGRQEVNLQSPGCLYKPGTPMHELMHALGFLHEQNRMERDSFVAIQYQNIQPSAKSNFDKAPRTEAFGVPYDYGSVMHYSANAFSTNGQPTIVAMQSGASNLMGQRDGFSQKDIDKLNQMYNCGYNSGSVNGPSGVQAPAPVPLPGPDGGTNNLIGSFLGGLITGLGLGDTNSTTTSE